ncbi:MAG: AraC family transcriptional regulator [Eubacteriales bacterium]|nr:AraC family transcriptional regulator [Eubacteriales bacterium]
MSLHHKSLDEEARSSFTDEEMTIITNLARWDPQKLYNVAMEKFFPSLLDNNNQQYIKFGGTELESYYWRPIRTVSNFARKNCFFLQLLYDSLVADDYYTIRSHMSSFLIVYTVSGTGQLKYSHKQYALNPGDAFIIDCRSPHDYRTVGSSWRHQVIHFDGQLAAGYFKHIVSGGHIVFHFGESSKFHALLTELFEANLHYSPDAELTNNCLLIQILTEFIRTSKAIYPTYIPENVLLFRDYLNEHCCERISLDDLCNEFKFSKSYICHEFKKFTGKSIGEYLTACKLDIAKDMLVYTDIPLKEIGEHIGYDNPSNFGKMFTKNIGISPNKYREKIKKL